MTRKSKKTSTINAAPPGLVRYATTKEWMPDRDGDGVVDPWDCVPWDPNQQGILGDAWSAAKRIVSPRVQRAQRVYTGARAGAEQAVRRTVSVSRRVGATVARYSPQVRQVRATTKFARAPVRKTRETYRYVTGVGATKKYVTEGRGYRSEVIMKHPTLVGDIKKAVRPVTSVVAATLPEMRGYVAATTGERMATTARGERRFVAEQTRAAPKMSPISVGIHKTTKRVAKVARGFEEPVERRVRDVERFFGLHSEAIPRPVRWAGAQVKGLGYGIAFHGPAAAVEMGGMIPGGLETIAKKPSVVPAAAAFGMFTMGKGMFEGITQRPGQTAGELIAMGAISKGVPKVPVPAKVSGMVPKMMTKVPTPEGLSPGKAIKFEAGLELAQKLAKVDAPVKRPLDFGDIQTLPKGSGKVVEAWIKAHPEQKSVIFGSGAARTQLKVSRKPGDIDIFMKDPATAAKQIHTKLVDKLGAENVSVGTATQRQKPGGHTVWTRVGGKWEHAVDIHARTEMTGRMTLGFETQTPIEIGGIKYTRVGEQVTRKAASVLQQKGSTIGPPKHREAKDVGDFLSISEQMIASRKAAAESTWLLSGYRTRRAAKLSESLRTYETHGYMYPDPMPVVRGYYALPRVVRTPGYVAAVVGIGAKYPPTTPSPTKYPKTYPTKYPKTYPTKYPKTYPTKYPKTVAPTYPKTVAPTYPKTVSPKTYPKVVTPTYPKTVAPTYPKTVAPTYPKTVSPKIIKPGGKKRKVREKAKEGRVFTGDPIKHELITLESFAGGVATGGKRPPSINIV